MTGTVPLRSIIAILREQYGAPRGRSAAIRSSSSCGSRSRTWVPDAQRRRAFVELRREVGLEPAAVLAASSATLRRIARVGGSIAVALRAKRLRDSAQMTSRLWKGDLARASTALMERRRLPCAGTVEQSDAKDALGSRCSGSGK